MNLPYKILLISILLIGGVFASSPYFRVYQLSNAVATKNEQEWQAMVQTDTFKQYTLKLLEGYLRLKLSLEMKNQNISTRTAMDDFTFAMKGIVRQTDKIISTKGFAHLVCGELARFPALPEQHKKECWNLEGKLHWQSPTLIKVSYKNPDSGWISQLYFERTGLFDWTAAGIELPVDKMFKQLKNQMLTSI